MTLKGSLYLLIIIALILLTGLVFWLTKTYPVAFVGSSAVLLKEKQDHFDIARKLDPKTDPRSALQQLIEAKKKQILVKRLNLDSDPEALMSELKFYKTGQANEYNKLLKDFFSGDEKLFEKFVLIPQVHDALLHIKYNSELGKNNDKYNLAENLLIKLQQGQKFEDLAEQYSQDKISAQFGGDLGFLAASQLLPELEKAVLSATLGEIKKEIVISRFGYHILFPVQIAEKDGAKVWHVKHMLIQTTGYEEWLDEQLKDIRIWRLVKI